MTTIREVSPIWTRRPDILKIDNQWKTQIQKFKTPKQAIKFVKTLNQTFIVPSQALNIIQAFE